MIEHSGSRSSQFCWHLNSLEHTKVESCELVVVVERNDLGDPVVGKHKSSEFQKIAKVANCLEVMIV